MFDWPFTALLLYRDTVWKVEYKQKIKFSSKLDATSLSYNRWHSIYCVFFLYIELSASSCFVFLWWFFLSSTQRKSKGCSQSNKKCVEHLYRPDVFRRDKCLIAILLWKRPHLRFSRLYSWYTLYISHCHRHHHHHRCRLFTPSSCTICLVGFFSRPFKFQCIRVYEPDAFMRIDRIDLISNHLAVFELANYFPKKEVF